MHPRRVLLLLGVMLIGCASAESSGTSQTSPSELTSRVEAGSATTAPDAAPTRSTAARTEPSPAPRTDVPVTPTTALVNERFDIAGGFVADGEVAISNGPDGAWNDVFVDPGAVVLVDGVIHLFFNGFNRFPGEVAIGYATSSDDGGSWIVSDVPLFDGTTVGQPALLASSVLVRNDIWTMYLYTWDGPWPAGQSRIMRATAPSPTGPWNIDATPVLEPGTGGPWTAGAVRSPSVAVDGEQLSMWFTGVSREGVAQIGRATSPDGVTWTTRDEPVLTAGDPGDWDAANVHQPRVTAGPDGWVMTYASANQMVNPTDFQQAHGLAVSTDGIAWRRSRTAVIVAADFARQRLWFSAIVWTGREYLLLPEVGAGGSTQIYAARHQGPLAIGG